MTVNKLKLNMPKTEAMLCSTIKKLSCVNATHMLVGSDIIHFSDKVSNLGVTIDNDLSMDSQISNVCRASYFEIRKLGQLRDYLDVNSTKIIASSCVLSRLDYCNSILAGCTDDSLKKLQKVQNNAARLVFKKTQKRPHYTIAKSTPLAPNQKQN